MAEIRLTSLGWQFIPFFIGFHTSQVVQDFSHQQYFTLFIGVISPHLERW